MSLYPHTMIERLVVKNYRSLEYVDIHLGPLTILVGPNSAGKSNFVDVLRFVRDALMNNLDASILDRHGISAVRRWSPDDSLHDVEIYLYLRGQDWTGEYGLILKSENSEEYWVDLERASIHEGDETIIVEARGGKWSQLPEGRQKDFLTENVPVSGKGIMLPLLARVFFPSLRKLSDFLSGMSFYTIYPNNIREPQKPSYSYPLADHGYNLASVLRQMKNSSVKDAINDALAKVVEGVVDYSVIQVGGYLVTRLHHSATNEGRLGPEFELAQESDGTLRILGILTALYQEPPRTLLAIEEPELTIHLGALGVLCDVLQEASLRSQIIVTTHSPDLISRFPVETLRVVDKEGNVTRIGPVDELQREAIVQKLFSPGELMRIEGLRRDTQTIGSIGE